MAPKKTKKAGESERKIRAARNVGSAALNAEIVQRYGSAAKEHYVAYSGVDNEVGKNLAKGLKGIAKSKLTEARNINQQAGFAAEVKHTARENAERIIKGKKTRVARYDDIKGTGNDQLIDHIEIGANGKPIDGTGSQMKFVKIGKSPKETAKALLSSKNRKYIESTEVKHIDVGADQYKGIKSELKIEIEQTKKQIEKMKAQGKNISAKEARLKQCQELDKKLRKSRVKTDEAVSARKHPALSTAKDIAKVSHRAGVQAAKGAAVLGGGISTIANVVAMVKGDKDASKAMADIAKDTAGACAVGYVTGAGGAAIKGALQNSGKSALRSLSKTNLPANIAVLTVETCKTLRLWLNGEIDGEQCLTELGEKGFGTTGGAMGAVLGQMAIPIPVVGAIVGSMIGYMMATSCYGELLGALRDAKQARAERIRIERESEEAIRLIRQYRTELEEMIAKYLADHTKAFNAAFDAMKCAAGTGDVDGFIDGANAITRKLGGNPKVKSMREFDDFMQTTESFVL